MDSISARSKNGDNISRGANTAHSEPAPAATAATDTATWKLSRTLEVGIVALVLNREIPPVETPGAPKLGSSHDRLVKMTLKPL
jgi:hypothetical protein